MEALREAEARLTVYVHPSNTSDVRGAVARQLGTLLFSYEDCFDGVLLAHEFSIEDPTKATTKTNSPKKVTREDVKAKQVAGEDTKAKEETPKNVVKAKILNGLVPYFGVPVYATLLLYSPQPDMILEGKVEMIGKTSIHVIVLGVFSAAIMADDINEKFRFRRKGDGGRFVSRSDKQHVIKRGSMIRFSVKGVDTDMHCHVTGSLITPHTGSMDWLSVCDTEYASEINRISSGKRRSRDMNIKIEGNEQEHRVLNSEDSVMKYERSHKSRKRSTE